ncbi:MULTISPECIES: SigE family RNA polymerase sigma factor [unclassified Crossiella]|uniref:SigE family RNA polymerase sigma factor n=1 Tax=unclassified Crossiella TaxID=2620835 RepID=UPI001FFFF095|nr:MULTISPECIES: SigE family RNA polymerase sigma factor [unclassified Crossiella]MCK2237489.1 SigE family RNA polymerase sigma factor [Crossiella sp. S99.2]MCK2254775.1 SigE family RNA polymerase sigma factor [Crossiella sp. S99.1]
MARRDDGFAEFFAARFDAARRIGYALCANWSEAEELAQTAFVRVYARWPKVHRETADAYLRTVLTRAFLDTKRRGRAREHAVAEVPDQPVEADHGAAEDRAALTAALQQVPPRQRAVLVLRFIQDLSVEQVAEALGCTTGTVKSQTARGLQTLRAAYHAANGTDGASEPGQTPPPLLSAGR